MANKLVALFLMSIVVLAAAAHMAQAHVDLQKDVEVSAKDLYTSCFLGCHKDCLASGHGNSRCEMNCDGSCVQKVHEAKLGGSSDVKVHL